MPVNPDIFRTETVVCRITLLCPDRLDRGEGPTATVSAVPRRPIQISVISLKAWYQDSGVYHISEE